jgi:superfamily II DNA or RNA helicase
LKKKEKKKRMDFEEIRNNTSFATEVEKYFKTVGTSTYLRYVQFLILKYFQHYPIRGMLFFHKTGVGKTMLAAAVTNWLTRDADAIFISAKTLHSNFQQGLDKFTKLSGENFIGKIDFVALNASNLYAQIDRSTLTSFEKFLDDKTKKRGSLNGKVIIVDEAHNLFNSITNGSSNSVKLYKAIMRSKCRILFLTGSPCTNDPFEFAVCFNMLAGRPIFGEDYKEFTDYFVKTTVLPNGEREKTIKNAGKFSNRINGLVSYYDTNAKDAIKGDVPEEKPIKIISVIMSKYQYGEYYQARKKEIEDQLRNKSTNTFTAPLTKSKGASSSYRVHSRQISNFCFPEYATEKHRDENNRVIITTIFDKLDHADVVKNINIYSPKIAKLVETACAHVGTGLIYSQFIKTGLGIISILLEARGIKFGIISGEVRKDIVDQTIKKFNAPENKNGDIMKLILVSATGAEGVDFKNLRHIHILEPYWHSSRLIQVIGRGVRLHSHADLPPESRNVQPFIYLSVHGIEGNLEKTTDEYLYSKSSRNMKLINSFYDVIKKSAIDCKMHYENCKKCEPTGKKLFTEDLENDIRANDPCDAPNLKAIPFEYEGETYYAYEVNGEIYFAVLVDGKYKKVDEETRQILLEYYSSLSPLANENEKK